jgi:histidinol-phosphate phosphatase family protein
MKQRRAVFLDRDGTINQEKHYLKDPSELEVFPQAGPALRRLQEAGYLLFIVTNQSGIGRGYFTTADMERVHARLAEILAVDGVRIERIYFAPEAPDQPSRGRKPSPQFLFDARDEHRVDLSQSFLIGDKLIDLQCAWNAGMHKAILVRTGYGADVEKNLGADMARTVVTDDLAGAADWILAQER